MTSLKPRNPVTRHAVAQARALLLAVLPAVSIGCSASEPAREVPRAQQAAKPLIASHGVIGPCSDGTVSCGTEPAGAAANSGVRVYRQVSSAECPVGTTARWEAVHVDADAPANASGSSTVRIAARANESLHALEPTLDDCAGCTTIATVTGVAAPANTMILLDGPLGVSEVHKDALELTLTVSPTPDGILAPTLRHWETTYSCVTAGDDSSGA